jgi:predicted flap endonuclease-1-like 5' DNA nuclease
MASIDSIECIEIKDATRLRKNGVRTTEALLKKAGTRRGRKDLASATGLADREVLDWVNRADLMRVKGIGAEYSDLLEAAGVDTVKELKTRSPAALTKRMGTINSKKKLVRRLPTESMVVRWVNEAKKLKPAVRY